MCYIKLALEHLAVPTEKGLTDKGQGVIRKIYKAV